MFMTTVTELENIVKSLPKSALTQLQFEVILAALEQDWDFTYELMCDFHGLH